MDSSLGFRFYAVPAHQLLEGKEGIPTDERVEPELPGERDTVERALIGAQFRDGRARDRLLSVLQADPAHRRADSDKPGAPGVFARPPDDLPALLRLADQLDSLAQTDDAGERARVWKCSECQTRYAVPVALVRTVSIVCEHCGHPVPLTAERSLGEESLREPFHGQVNRARRELAEFFREAMARGWPVLVCRNES